MDNTVMQVVGLLGPLFLLGAYALLSSGKLVATSPLYQGMNLIGAGVMTWVGFATGTWAVWVLNGTWALIAVLGLIRISMRNRAAAA